MALALTVDVPAFEVPARHGSVRSATWSRKIAAMSRRLEARWARGTPNPSEPQAEVEEMLCASFAARIAFENAMFELAASR